MNKQIVLFLLLLLTLGGCRQPVWSEADLATLQSLSLSSLPPLPPDPSNAVADDKNAARLGRALFFDPRLSADGTIACATCHSPALAFTDGRALAQGIGINKRNAPTLIGSAYSPWQFWDGRADSQWAQALAPLESDVEHGGNRLQFVSLIETDPKLKSLYEIVFGSLPLNPTDDPATIDRIFTNLGKAIAAHERSLLPTPARFDQFADAVVANQPADQLTPDEIAGLRLFIGDANCILCHNGPLFTNNTFHNTGVPELDPSQPDMGRINGADQVIEDPFNCLGEFSDAQADACAELRFIKTFSAELMAAFKTPTLRNVELTAPYMHSGQIDSLHAAIIHYNQAPRPLIGHSDLIPLNLTPQQITQLESFLQTLTSLTPIGGPPR